MIRRPLITAALLLAAGAAEAQTAGRPATPPAAPAQGMTPATPAGPTTPASPTAPATPGATSDPSAAQPAPAAPSASALAATPPSGAAFASITAAPGADAVAVLTQSGQFSTLLRAADATALTSVLKTPGLTVFAPTDAAFAALPAGTLDTLMKPDNLPQLQKLLAYHVINTKIPSIKGHAQTQIATVAGPKLTLDGTGGQVKVNDATALQPAVSAAGGATIYPIDKVLSPDFVPPPAPAAEAAVATDAPAATTTTRKTTPRKKR